MSTGLLSDKSYSSRLANVVSQHRGYSDLDISLYLGEQTKGDIVPLLDIDAIKNSVRILLQTNHFDRPFQPYLGADLSSLLFEPPDQFTEYCIRENIIFTLERHEPRIDNIEVKAQYDDAANEYKVTVTFRVKAYSQNVDMTLYLTRVR